MGRTCIALLLSVLVVACGTRGTPGAIDPRTGLIEDARAAKAHVLVDKPIALAPFQRLAVVMPHDFDTTADEAQQLRAVGYFGQVLSVKDLQKFVIDHKLQERVMTFSNWEGYKELYRAYGPYLIVRFQCVEKAGIRYRLLVTHPETREDLFVSEVKVWSEAGYTAAALATLGAGMGAGSRCAGSDQAVRYPLVNSLIGWINAHR